MSSEKVKRDRGGLASFQVRRTTADIHCRPCRFNSDLQVVASSVFVTGEIRELVGSDRDLHSRIFDIGVRGVERRVDGFANLVQRTQGTALQGNVGQSERGIIDVFGEGKRDRGGLASFQARRTLLISTVGSLVSTAISRVSPTAFWLSARSANLLAAIEICIAGSSTSVPGV